MVLAEDEVIYESPCPVVCKGVGAGEGSGGRVNQMRYLIEFVVDQWNAAFYSFSHETQPPNSGGFKYETDFYDDG